MGGEGARLRPLTYTTPKPLLPICNSAFLDRQLDWLAAHGISEVVLSLGYLPDAFREHFAGGTFAGMQVSYAVEEQPLGTAGGIRFAAGEVGERVVVCNGDVLTDLDLSDFVRFHDEVGAEATIALTQVDDPSAFGVVPTRSDGSVIAFVEKPPAATAPTNWINAGTYVLEPSVLERIPTRLQVSIEREVFPRMLESGGRLFALRSDAYWLDIGTPDKYLQAHTDLLQGRLDPCPYPGAREVAPRVWVDGEVTIAPGATLEAPVLIADGVYVERGAVVRGSALGSGSRVASGASVIRSVVHPKAVLGTGSEVVDSVVGPGARLDDGAQIREGTLVGAGVTVRAGEPILGGRLAPESV